MFITESMILEGEYGLEVGKFQSLQEALICLSSVLCNHLCVCVRAFLFCQDDPLEETGWKLVHGDVFRPPRYPTMLVVCLGSGIQILSMVMIIISESCVCLWILIPCVSLNLSLSLLSQYLPCLVCCLLPVEEP